MLGTVVPPEDWPLALEDLLAEEQVRFESLRTGELKTLPLDQLDRPREGEEESEEGS
jgi:hypothetical protein